MKRALFVALSGLLATVAIGCAKKEAPPPPPPEVKVATVVQRDVPIYVEAIGQTRGSTEIEVRARVEGFLESVDYKEGNPVKKGQLLYTIDPRPSRRRSPRPRARSPRPRRSSRARTQDVVRYEPLVAKNAISRQEYETAVQLRAARRKPTLEAAKASAQRVRARPLATRRVAGARRGARGARRRSTRARWWAAARARCSRASRRSTRSTCASPSRSGTTSSTSGAARSGGRRGSPAPLKFELVLSDGSVHPHKGDARLRGPRRRRADRHDPGRGRLPQSRAASCGPASSRRVRVAIDEKKGAILVPQRAVHGAAGHLQRGRGRSRTTPSSCAWSRPPSASARSGSSTPGSRRASRIVVEGVQKVRAGIKVTPESSRIDGAGGSGGLGRGRRPAAEKK